MSQHDHLLETFHYMVVEFTISEFYCPLIIVRITRGVERHKKINREKKEYFLPPLLSCLFPLPPSGFSDMCGEENSSHNFETGYKTPILELGGRNRQRERET